MYDNVCSQVTEVSEAEWIALERPPHNHRYWYKDGILITMIEINLDTLNIIFLVFSILVTIYVIVAKNPFEKGAGEYQALRICRIGLALFVWSIDFGLIGFPLALAALILGIIGFVKGRTVYGMLIIIGSVLSPIFNIYRMLGYFSKGIVDLIKI